MRGASASVCLTHIVSDTSICDALHYYMLAFASPRASLSTAPTISADIKTGSNTVTICISIQ